MIAQMDVLIIALLGCDDGGIHGPNDPRVPESLRKAWPRNNDVITADYDPEAGRFTLAQPHDNISDYIDAPSPASAGVPRAARASRLHLETLPRR